MIAYAVQEVGVDLAELRAARTEERDVLVARSSTPLDGNTRVLPSRRRLGVTDTLRRKIRKGRPTIVKVRSAVEPPLLLCRGCAQSLLAHKL